MTTPTPHDRLLELASKATPGKLDTAESINGGTGDCPLCEGEGLVDVNCYENYDGHAVSVEFFGVGFQHKHNEAFYRACDPTTITSLVLENRRLREALTNVLAVCVRVGDTTRDDVDAINAARAALQPEVKK